MTELMRTGRDSSFMIGNISFTKQVHFYICKIQIKPKLYPLSRNRNTVHHYYHIADTASVAPTHYLFIVVYTGEPHRQCRSSRGPCLTPTNSKKTKNNL